MAEIDEAELASLKRELNACQALGLLMTERHELLERRHDEQASRFAKVVDTLDQRTQNLLTVYTGLADRCDRATGALSRLEGELEAFRIDAQRAIDVVRAETGEHASHIAALIGSVERLTEATAALAMVSDELSRHVGITRELAPAYPDAAARADGAQPTLAQTKQPTLSEILRDGEDQSGAR
jgi:alkylhydroperoxidase/carboxymuconolactone decarboxylase family protein YurZ